MRDDRDRLVLVYSAPSVAEGYLAKGRLETEGIPVFMKSADDGPYPIGGARLWVPSGFEIQAKIVLDESNADDATPAEVSPDEVSRELRD
jgi:hypothetical protein